MVVTRGVEVKEALNKARRISEESLASCLQDQRDAPRSRGGGPDLGTLGDRPPRSLGWRESRDQRDLLDRSVVA